jgi:hypothetical protein
MTLLPMIELLWMLPKMSANRNAVADLPHITAFIPPWNSCARLTFQVNGKVHLVGLLSSRTTAAKVDNCGLERCVRLNFSPRHGNQFGKER